MLLQNNSVYMLDFGRGKVYTLDSRYIAVIYNTVIYTEQQFTMIQLPPDFAFTNDTPYLALTGELWGVFREILKDI